MSNQYPIELASKFSAAELDSFQRSVPSQNPTDIQNAMSVLAKVAGDPALKDCTKQSIMECVRSCVIAEISADPIWKLADIIAYGKIAKVQISARGFV